MNSPRIHPGNDEGSDARQRSEPSDTATTQQINGALAAILDQGQADGHQRPPAEHAIQLALAGCPVFPCWPDGQGNRKNGRPLHKSPRITNWPGAASTDVTQVIAWWKKWPDALVAVPTGSCSGLYVLDVDLKPGLNGADTLTKLGLIPPSTRVHYTLTGGSHWLYSLPPDGLIAKTDASVIGPGVDRRGEGGYIIWWPAHGGKVTPAIPVAPPSWMVRDAVGHRPEVIFPPIGLSDTDFEDLMRRIQPELMGSRSEWIKVGMALHHETEGEERGLIIWDRYSQTWPKYEGRATLEREWSTFGRGRGSHISMRSLMPKGWCPLPTEAGFGVGVEVPLPSPPPPPPPGEPMYVPPLPQGMVDARDGNANSRPLTEHGNALRIFDQHGNNLRYVVETKAWVYWSDGAWHWDTEGAVPRQMAANLAPKVYAEGKDNIHEAVAYAKWARKTQEGRTVKASVGLLADMDVLRVPVVLLDHDIMTAGLDGGRLHLDLQTGAVRPAVPGDYLTKSLGVRKVGSARDCPQWLRFLDQVFYSDGELIDWIQRWCGYMLTGDVSEQFFCFAFGSGRNGKGTFAELIKFIMGDYAKVVAAETLTAAKRSAGGASPDVVALVGARLVLSAETNDGSYMAEGLIKTLTGGDTISTRQVYGTQFEFLPQFKMLISGNHKPVIKGVDYAIWARVRLIPFTRTFSDEQRDPQLQKKLRAEAPHILAWMIEGCLRWQRRGLRDVPVVVKQATQDYKTEMDIFGAWLEERINTDDPSGMTAASSLYQDYRAWATENGHKFPMTNQAFGRKLTERGFKKKHTKTGDVWLGFALRMFC